MHYPTDLHWMAVKRLLRYLAGTWDRGIFLRGDNEVAVQAFSNTDSAGDKDNYQSTGAYVHCLSWFSSRVLVVEEAKDGSTVVDRSEVP